MSTTTHTQGSVTSDSGLRRLAARGGYVADWNSSNGEYVIETASPYSRVFAGTIAQCARWLAARAAISKAEGATRFTPATESALARACNALAASETR